MTTLLLFHHAQGQTPGFLAFTEVLREAGHKVDAPDLYEGMTFEDIDEGVANARRVGFEEIIRRGTEAAEALPADIVYAGFSLGVMPAQSLAQTRPGARGAIFFHGAMPPAEFGGSWPDGVPLQIHFMDDDPWAEEDRPAAETLAKEVEGVELFIYPGDARVPRVRRGAAGGRSHGPYATWAAARRSGPSTKASRMRGRSVSGRSSDAVRRRRKGCPRTSSSRASRSA